MQPANIVFTTKTEWSCDQTASLESLILIFFFYNVKVTGEEYNCLDAEFLFNEIKVLAEASGSLYATPKYFFYEIKEFMNHIGYMSTPHYFLFFLQSQSAYVSVRLPFIIFW